MQSFFHHFPLRCLAHSPPLLSFVSCVRVAVCSLGYLSRKKRKIRIINMLSHQDDLLEVCAEERLRDIRDRYLIYNRHAMSYTWKRLGRVLNMELNLEENGIPDETEEFANLNIDEDQYIPALHVHFNDDLTVD